MHLRVVKEEGLKVSACAQSHVNLEKMKTLSLFTVIVLIASVLGGNDPVISWPSSYITTGIVTLPYAEITEPFTMYMDGDSNLGRMETYDGKYNRQYCMLRLILIILFINLHVMNTCI